MTEENPVTTMMMETHEANQHVGYPRPYLGMSSIGDDCDRKNWLDFYWSSKKEFPASTLFKFQDGHYSEKLTAERLAAIPSITLYTTAPGTDAQYSYADFNGHMKGHCDGKISGMPLGNTWHIWEHKCTELNNFNKLKRLIDKHGQKDALQHWSATYYGQAQLYMSYSGSYDHFMTVSSAGSRQYLELRTELDADYAEGLKARAADIIFSDADQPIERFHGASLNHHKCKQMCDNKDVCYGIQAPAINCRTCKHSNPMEFDPLRRAYEGWYCGYFRSALESSRIPEGCNNHIYRPEMLAPRFTLIGDQESFAIYEDKEDFSCIVNIDTHLHDYKVEELAPEMSIKSIYTSAEIASELYEIATW